MHALNFPAQTPKTKLRGSTWQEGAESGVNQDLPSEGKRLAVPDAHGWKEQNEEKLSS